MAQQYCFICNQEKMTWAIDEKESPFTYWHCSNCDKIVGWEDESKQRDCKLCKTKDSELYMWNEKEVFWYCTSCKNKEKIKEKL